MLLLIVSFAGCGTPFGPSTEFGRPSAERDDTHRASRGGLDALFASIAHAHPTFGGASVDNGRLTIYVTADALSSTPSRFVSRVRGRLGPVLRGRGVMKRPPVLRRVRYSYDQLARWRLAARPVVFTSPHVHALDIQEADNRLVIGIQPGTPTEPLLQRLQHADIPRPAIQFEDMTAPAPMSTLQTPHALVHGGHQIEFGEASVCTAGFNAYFGGEPVYVTASHCTATPGANSGTIHRHGGRRIGREIFDPYRTPALSGCPPGHTCRYSDVAIGQFDEPDAFDYARLARPVASDPLAGPVEISPQRPTFTVREEAAYPTLGETLHKVGRTTGWTYGTVTATCRDVRVSDTTTLLCQDQVTAGVDGGDSGAPVFSLDGNDATLYGVVWGRAGNSFLFSSLYNIREDIRRTRHGTRLRTHEVEPFPWPVESENPFDGADDAYTK